jgi:dihydroorotate dehydrogenase electron transfer subunit
VFDVVGPGTKWLSTVKSHDMLEVIGPLGRAFHFPKDDRLSCLLVGGGYGAAPLHFLAEELRARGKAVNMLVGARSDDRVFKPIEAKRLAASVWITTEDGSMGDQGKVTDLLPDLIDRTAAEVIYACGPNPMLRAVAEHCIERNIPCQVAVEEQMACGVGVCWSCVVPLLAADGQSWWNVRTCMEGPVFNAARVWWDRWMGEPDSKSPQPPEPVRASEVAEAWRS